MAILIEGVQLERIMGTTTSDGSFVLLELGSGPRQCKEMVVTMEYGQQAFVPYAKCTRNDGTIEIINLATIELVTLKEKAE